METSVAAGSVITTYNQCRFCLRVIDQIASYSIFPEDDQNAQSNALYTFVQRMLSLEFTAENSCLCGDCFAVWQMIQDYVQACASANKILLLSTTLTVRKPWLSTDEENRMLIEVCRRVKKLRHEMEILLKTVQRVPRKGDTAGRKRKSKESTPNGKQRQEPEVSRKDVDRAVDEVKHEEEVEIDDSDAFQTNDPIEARRKEPEEEIGQMEEIVTVIEVKDDPPGNANANESMDDAVTIIEPKVDKIDLVNSSSEEEDDDDDDEEEEDDEAEEDDASPENEDDYPSSWRRRTFDENVLKTVCQLCGVTTDDMANHLESHINDPEANKRSRAPPVPPESDSSNSSSSLKRKRKRNASQKPAKAPPPVPQNPLKCNICGTDFTSMLAAKLHARSHITVQSRTAHGSGKPKSVARRSF